MSDDELSTIRRAITAVRREGYKAAAIYAVLDGTLLALAANLLVTVLAIAALPRPAVPATVGVGGAIASFAVRIRRPLIERFEAVNPEVHEALRTARDAMEEQDTRPMARALYRDVIDRLRHTSSVGLLSLPRIAARIVLVVVLSVAVIQASMLGVGLGGTAPTDGTGNGAPTVPTNGGDGTPAGLQPGDEVLGEPETITPGGENLSAVIGRQAGQGEEDRQREYETGGLGDDGGIEAERVGYAPPDDVEDAELIKAYNLRIREETNE